MAPISQMIFSDAFANVDPIHWHIYAALEGNKLMETFFNLYIIWPDLSWLYETITTTKVSFGIKAEGGLKWQG